MPAGGSELWENIWSQLGRVCFWMRFNWSTMGTCRIGGLRPFGKSIVGSRRVSDMKVSGVSQQMIQERWGWDSILVALVWGEEGNHAWCTVLSTHSIRFLNGPFKYPNIVLTRFILGNYQCCFSYLQSSICLMQKMQNIAINIQLKWPQQDAMWFTSFIWTAKAEIIKTFDGLFCDGVGVVVDGSIWPKPTSNK